MKRYSQRDPQWKAQIPGFDSQSALGDYGCLLTDIARVASVYGFNENPASLNAKMKAVQGFRGALAIPSLIGKALPGMVCRDSLDRRSQPAPAASVGPADS